MKRKSAPKGTHRFEYITDLIQNKNFRILKREFKNRDIDLAAKYLSETYPSLWENANKNRKINFIRELLEVKRLRGYGSWEIESYMSRKLEVNKNENK